MDLTQLANLGEFIGGVAVLVTLIYLAVQVRHTRTQQETKPTMKVIGAGFQRTGTMSTQAALRFLGFACYHMREVPREPGHLDAWMALVQDERPMDWRGLFRGYDATVDMPACWYYQELMEAFPDAKVLLNMREPDRWYQSLETLWNFVNRMRSFRFVPKLGKFLAFVDALNERVFGRDRSKENCIRVFNEHNAAVQRTVPAERLLVFQVTEGWEPLCAFLGCEVPDVPFPHLNEGDESFGAQFREIFLSGIASPTEHAAVVRDPSVHDAC
jgi:hypothetical protein